MEQCKPKGQLLGAVNGADAIGSISLTQCSRIAMGSCQQAAGDTAPCQDAGAKGFGSCSAEKFQAVFHKKAGGLCQQWARSVTDVDPDSGKWAPAGGRRLL
ncbi:hypothetical protein MNEG_5435 [Monoraphidium neglectum]|jgi:hypothetical protein|uniref:Uncharacterized protein n=1 Tax=Monoraphidium neglectum TaxID=145388 RepID=A0A0D2MHH0_9CHLO|nr:hypothetical protein MNEG_5435 [Monoraphidium neglectum]KIZ02525.1 hypothetical protein MNEG_5435 [Monoraphidium neglectum]|eukprot:XP_013901544.1 hypothetical protein MNEG_5435 [Monoraphidium neglectum]